MEENKKKDNLTEYRALLGPAAGMLVVGALILYTIYYAFGMHSDVQQEIEILEQQKSSLATKVTHLQSSEEFLQTTVGPALTALPDANPTLQVYSQVRRAMEITGLNAQTIRTSTATAEEIESNVNMSSFRTTMLGSLSGAYDFVRELGRSSPVVTVNGLTYDSEDQETVNIQLEFAGYWYELPREISAVDQPLNPLTEQEMETLSVVASYNQPSLNTEAIPPTQTVQRENPFEF